MKENFGDSVFYTADPGLVYWEVGKEGVELCEGVRERKRGLSHAIIMSTKISPPCMTG